MTGIESQRDIKLARSADVVLEAAKATSCATTFTFDANGNQQIENAPTGRTTATWDFENQPTLYQLPDGSRVTMMYNADNRRVWKES